MSAMEKYFCLLVLFIANSAGLQFPLSYQYHYTASIAAALPDVGIQQAAASIDTTVVVDTINNEYAIVKFKDTRVTSHHGDTHCGQPGSVGHTDHPAPDSPQMLHKPFMMNFRYNRRRPQPLMEVHQDEPLWITNVRKAVASLLRVVPTVERKLRHSPTSIETNSFVTRTKVTPLQPTAFIQSEDTIHGNCPVQYTLTAASALERHSKPALHKDMQRRKGDAPDGSWPKISDHLYVLQRSPVFSECSEQPFMFHSSNGHATTNNTHGEYEENFSRSSLGRFLIRGENNPNFEDNLRLERAQVEGGVEMSPLGATGTTLQILTNQTMVLEVTNYKRGKPRVSQDMKPVTTLKFEMVSPFGKPTTLDPDWIRFEDKRDASHPVYPEHYLTGRAQTTVEINNLKTKLLRESAEVEQILLTSMGPHAPSSKSHHGVSSGATVAPQVAEHMASISDIVRALPRPALQDVLHQLASKSNLSRQLFGEVLATSGAPSATELLLEEVLSQQLPPTSAYLAVAGLATNICSPSTVLHLMSFLKTLAERIHQSPVVRASQEDSSKVHPHSTLHLSNSTSPPSHSEGYSPLFQRTLLAMASLITSSAIRRVCCPSNEIFYGEEYSKACHIEAEFFSFLKEQIQKSNSTSHKATLTYAAGLLNLPQAFEFVAGQTKAAGTVVLLRTAAIFSMMPHHTPHSYRTKVFEALQPVLEAQVESPEVRQAVAMVLLSWRPDEAWWLRLARSSWKEESKAMAEFIFTACKTISQLKSPAWRKQSSHAGRALSLVKPVLAPSKQSFLKIIESFAQPPMMEAETKLGWILNVKTMLPEDLFLALNTRMNGVQMPLLQAVFLGDDLASIWSHVSPPLRPHNALHNAPHPVPHPQPRNSLHDEQHALLNRLGAAPSSRSGAEGLLLTQFFSDTHLSLPITRDWLVKTLAPVWSSNFYDEKDVHFVKYLNPVQREVMVPSDVGLPIIGRIQTPVVFYQNGKYKMATHRGQHFTAQTAQKDEANASSYGVDISYQGNTTFSATMQSTVSALVPWLNITVEAGVHLKAALVVPNTTVGLRVGLDEPGKEVELYVRLGFDKKVPVLAAAKVPFTVSRVMEPGPDTPGTKVLHKLKDVLSPHSATKKSSYNLPTAVTGIAGHVTYEAEEEAHHDLPYNPWAYFYQVGSCGGGEPPLRRQETAVFLDTAGHATKHVSITVAHVPATKSYNEKHSGPVELQLQDSKEARMLKLDQFTGAGGYMASIRANFSGAYSKEERHYELVMLASAVEKNDSNHQLHRYQVTFLSAGLPSNDSNAQQMCLLSEVISPGLPPMDRLDKLLEGPLQAGVKAELRMGETCGEGKEVAKLASEFSISVAQLQLLSRNLPGQCNFDRLDPTTSLRRAAFYDSLQLDLAWKQDLPGPLLNGSYLSANALRGLTFPYSSTNCLHVSSPQRRIVLNVTRSLHNKAATGWLTRPSCREYIEALPMPGLLDMVLPVHGRHTLREVSRGDGERHHHVPAVVPPGDQCYVLPHRVVTFDGVSFSMAPSTCDRVVVEYTSDQQSFVLLSRASTSAGSQAFKLLVPHEALDIRIEGPQVTVNGTSLHEQDREIVDGSHRVLATIRRSEDTLEVRVPSLLHLFVKGGDKLVVQLTDGHYRGALRGLCGNFDGVSVGELMGPRGCLYSPTDGEVFASAWTNPPCESDYALRLLWQHQWTCPKTVADLGLPAPPTHDTSFCNHSVHRLLETRGLLCLTTVPINACLSSCAPLPSTQRDAMFEVKCWAADTAPRRVQRARAAGFLRTMEETAGSLMPMLLSYPMECVPRH